MLVLDAPTANIISGMLIGVIIKLPKIKFFLFVRNIALEIIVKTVRLGEPKIIVINNNFILSIGTSNTILTRGTINIIGNWNNIQEWLIKIT